MGIPLSVTVQQTPATVHCHSRPEEAAELTRCISRSDDRNAQLCNTQLLRLKMKLKYTIVSGARGRLGTMGALGQVQISSHVGLRLTIGYSDISPLRGHGCIPPPMTSSPHALHTSSPLQKRCRLSYSLIFRGECQQ